MPFVNKWGGFGHWHDTLPRLAAWAAAAGLVVGAFAPIGRFLLLLLLSSLVPYAFTWQLGGGGEWRFTQHAYPFYLVFAAWTLVATAGWAARAVGRRTVRPSRPLLRLLQGATVAFAAALAIVWQNAAPLLAANEALRASEAITLTAGDRDGWVFGSGWSEPVRSGVPYRMAQTTVTGLRLPVGRHREFWLTLRLDPVETVDPARQPTVAVYLDRRLVAQLRLSRTPARMGSYRIRITDHPPRTFSRLEFVASHTVPAGEAGLHFSSLAADAPAAFRLWYVRVDPDGGS